MSATNKVLVFLCLFDLHSEVLDVLVGPLAGASRQTAPIAEESYQAVTSLQSFKKTRHSCDASDIFCVFALLVLVQVAG